MTKSNRVATYERYSLVQLKNAWGKASELVRRQLKVSCETEDKEYLKSWAKRNNVLTVTNYASTTGISLIEVAEWVKSA